MAKRLKQAFFDFLQYEVGAAVRNTPSQKVRTYKNIEIRESFKKL